MKSIVTLLAFVWCGILALGSEAVPRLHNEYDPEKWPEVDMKLSTSATLKDVFDSGLRPYRHPGLETSLLEVKHINLRITLGSNRELPPIQVELMNLTPYRDGEIATIEGFTPRLTIDQARAQLKMWLPYGEDGRSLADLDSLLGAASKDPMDFDDPYRGVSHGSSVTWKEPGWKERGGGPQVVTWLRKTTSAEEPVRLYFKLSWSSNRPLKERQFHKTPIPPPPGYESVSMSAPEKFGPDSGVDILRSKGVDIGDGRGGIAYADYVRQKELSSENPESSVAVVAKAESDSEPTGIWLQVGVFAAIAVVICCLYFIARKYYSITRRRS